MSPASPERTTSPASDRWLRLGVNILNGFVGDHLQARRNSLAIEMGFRIEGRPVRLEASAIRASLPAATSRLCILVHGLGCDEHVWQFAADGTDETNGVRHRQASYGSLLAEDQGYTSLFVRYNTGLSIEENGTKLARLLGELLVSYPSDVDEIVLLGHSMGGVVIRSACRAAEGTDEAWLAKLRHTIMLGAPLDGADLARFARLSSALLRVPSHPVTSLIGDVVDVRSRGIKDLSLGWRDVPLPAGARHHEIFGALNRSRSHLATRLFGDGLVRSRAGNAPENVRHFPGVGHLELAANQEVYRQIREWCRA